MSVYPATDAERQQLADRLTQKGLIPTQSRRRMVKAKIEQMVKDMQNNRFDWNASAREPVQLSPRNEVYGGHHRLIAAEIAGIDLLNIPGQWIRLTATSSVRPSFHWIDVLPAV